MEKYRKFADAFTGKNPFLPIYLNSKKNTGNFLTHLFLGPILVAIRLPIFFLCILIGLLYHLVIENLIVVAVVRRKITLITDNILFRIILSCFGVYSPQSSFRLGTKKQPKDFNSSLILANHTSPIDIFYLSYLVSPQFTKLNFKNYGQ